MFDMLDWTRQPIRVAAEHIVDHLNAPQQGAECAVLVSGRRLRRLLNRELVHAHQRVHDTGALLAPLVLTPSSLVERFFLSNSSLAIVEESTALLHWLAAFGRLGPDAKRLLDPNPGPASSVDRLSGVRRYREVCEQLDAIGVDPADVPDASDGSSAPDRWRALSSLRTGAHAELERHGWVERTALHRSMIDSRRLSTEAPQDLFVLGVTDPGPLTVGVLEVLGDRAHLMVDAPEARRGDFDEFGRPVPEVWCDLASPLRKESMHLVERPVDAGEVLLELLEDSADSDGILRGDQLTVGLCDERYGELLERTGRRSGVPLRASVGVSLSRSQPVRLLELLSRYLTEPSITEFAALLRVPMWEELLSARLRDESSDALKALDAWSQKRVGATLEEFSNTPLPGGGDAPPPVLVRVLEECDVLLNPLRTATSVSHQVIGLRSLFELLEGASSFTDELDEFWKHAEPMFDAVTSDQHLGALAKFTRTS